MLETGEIMLVQNEDGTFSNYDDSNDVVISCENEEQCEEVVELLKRQLKPVKPIILDTLNGQQCNQTGYIYGFITAIHKR